MANNIRGITVEIGGSTGPLSTALKDVNKTAGDLQSELREVNKQLKFDPGNATLLRQKMELLSQSTEALKQKEAALKEAVAQAQTQFENGELGADKVRAVERELEKVSSQLRSTEAEEKGATNSMSGWKSAFSKLTEQSKNSTSAIAGHFGSLKSTIAGFVTGLVSGLSLNSIIAATDTAEKTTAQMNAVLKSTGSAAGMTVTQLNALAASQAKVTTFSAGTTTAAENMLLTFTNIKSSVFPQTIRAAEDMATAMGTDATSAAMTLGKALNDPSSGLTKLTKQGVTFTDAQKNQIKAMQKAGDVAGAQSVILKELQKEFGGSAEAAGKTFTGQIQIMTNNLKSAGVTIVASLIPVITNTMPSIVHGAQQIAAAVTAHKADIVAAVQAASSVVKGAFSFVEQHGTLVKVAVVGIASAFGIWKIAMLTANTVSTVSNALQALGIVKSGAAAGAKLTEAAATNIATTAQSGLNIAMLPTIGIIVGIVAAIALLAAGAYELVTHWQQVSTFFVGLWNTLKSSVANVGQAIKTAFDGAVSGIKSVWGGVTGFFSGLWNGIKTGVATAFNAVKTVFITVWTSIKTVVLAIITPFVTSITNAWKGVSTGISTAMNGLKTILSAAWDFIKTYVLGVVLLLCDIVTGNWTKLGEDAGRIFGKLAADLQAIWTGIQEVVTGVWQVISSFLTELWTGIIGNAQTIWNGLTSFFSSLWAGISTALQTAWNAIKDFFAQFWANEIQGWKNIWTNVSTFFANLPGRLLGFVQNAGTAIINGFNAAVSFLTGLPEKFLAWGIGMVSSLVSGIKSIIGTVGSTITGGFNAAITFITSLPAKALQWGKDFINGFINGIKGCIGDVQNAVTDVANKIRSFLHFSAPDEGPLADYEKWMPDFMQGLAEGIKNNESKITTAITSVASKMSSTLKTGLDKISQTVTSNYDTLISNIKTRMTKLTTDIKTVVDDYNKQVSDLQNSIYSSTGLFDAVSTSDDTVTGDSLTSNLQGQVAQLQTWQSTVDSLKSKGVSNDLMKQLQAMGPSATASLQALNSMTSTQLDNYVNLWKQKTDLSKQAAEGQLTEEKTEAEAKIKTLEDNATADVKTYTTTWSNGTKTVETQLSALAKSANTWGGDMIKGLINGLNSERSNLEATVSSLAATISSQLHFSKPDTGPLTDYEKWMPDFVSGLSSTLTDSIPALKSAVCAAADTLQTGFKVQSGMAAAAGTGTVQQAAEAQLSTADTVKAALKGGDVNVYQNIYSKTASPSEHARQTKNSLRQLGLGFSGG